jgi:tetratricopeptide (TPR) repeat protein
MKTKRILPLLLLAVGTIVPGVRAQDNRDLALMSAYTALTPYIERARTALRKDLPDKARTEILFCLERLPEHQEAHFLMAQVLYKKGDYGGALEHVRAAEEGYLRMAKAVAALEQQKLKNKSQAMDALNEELEDIAAADAAVKNRGSCTPDRFSQALQESKEEMIKEQEARATVDPTRDIGPVPAPYLYLHGNVLFMLKRTAEAEAEYRQAIRKDPDFGETYNNLINILYAGGRVDEARAVLAQAEAHKAKVHPELKKAVLGQDRK